MFGKKSKEDDNPFSGLRNRLFDDNPTELKITPSTDLPNVWALLMDMGYKEGCVTLLVVADHTTSLYLPTGGGVLGAGSHRTVWAASKAFLETGEAVIDSFTTASDRSVPKLGEIKFHLFTYDHTRMASGDEQQIGNGVGPLSALFFAGQAVISQVRLISSQKTN